MSLRLAADAVAQSFIGGGGGSSCATTVNDGESSPTMTSTTSEAAPRSDKPAGFASLVQCLIARPSDGRGAQSMNAPWRKTVSIEAVAERLILVQLRVVTRGA